MAFRTSPIESICAEAGETTTTFKTHKSLTSVYFSILSYYKNPTRDVVFKSNCHDMSNYKQKHYSQL